MEGTIQQLLSWVPPVVFPAFLRVHGFKDSWLERISPPLSLLSFLTESEHKVVPQRVLKTSQFGFSVPPKKAS